MGTCIPYVSRSEGEEREGERDLLRPTPHHPHPTCPTPFPTPSETGQWRPRSSDPTDKQGESSNTGPPSLRKTFLTQIKHSPRHSRRKGVTLQRTYVTGDRCSSLPSSVPSAHPGSVVGLTVHSPVSLVYLVQGEYSTHLRSRYNVVFGRPQLEDPYCMSKQVCTRGTALGSTGPTLLRL